MFDLSGKRALVTGASGGIGGAIARTLHERGASVALSGTRADALEALSAELGHRAYTTPADLTKTEAANQLVDLATEAMGGIDILVNNAGLTHDMLALRMTDENWQSVIDVNLTAAFRLSRGALRGMIQRRWGRIISISSVVGVTGNPGQSNYTAAKAGLIGLSKSLAREVANRGVTVNCIAPGFIETAMTEALTDAQREKMLATIPSNRFGTVDEVASAVVFLACEEAGYLTGQTLHVNGGMAMI
jgi:3-oxoacyl-[acyl-carrier protein] reductase